MTNERNDNQYIGELSKRKKFIFFLAGICFGMSIFCFGLIAFTGRLAGISTFILGLLLLFFSVMLYVGGMKLDKELERKKNK